MYKKYKNKNLKKVLLVELKNKMIKKNGWKESEITIKSIKDLNNKSYWIIITLWNLIIYKIYKYI